MTDYSDAEIAAIEQAFANCKTYLCDFHREQCWERWVKDRKHGLSQQDGECLLMLLRKCAHAQPDNNIPFGHNYRKQVNILKESHVWIKHVQVRDWLQAKWLSIPEVS